MLKNAETVFFLLATVAALALPAVPAVQEALTADYSTVEAALPFDLMERIEIVLRPRHQPPAGRHGSLRTCPSCAAGAPPPAAFSVRCFPSPSSLPPVNRQPDAIGARSRQNRGLALTK